MINAVGPQVRPAVEGCSLPGSRPCRAPPWPGDAVVLLDTSFGPVRQGISYDTSQAFVLSIFIIFEKSYFMVTFCRVIWENYS